jgi:hypothetical protein
MNTYSKKVTLLMVVLSVLNATVVYIFTENIALSSLMMIITYFIQITLAFALGKIKTKPSLEASI